MSLGRSWFHSERWVLQKPAARTKILKLCPFLPLVFLFLCIKKAFIKERSNHPEVQTERIQEGNYLFLDAVKYITLFPPLPLQLCSGGYAVLLS